MSIVSAAYWPGTEPAPGPEIRALTIRQPWAACVASGQKLTENRTWPTKYRGLLAIHAAQSVDTGALQISASREHIWRALAVDPALALRRSAVIAVAQLVDCHLEDHQGCCAPWGETGPKIWHWQLADVRALPRPVSCKGRLSLWHLPADVLAAVAPAVARPRGGDPLMPLIDSFRVECDDCAKRMMDLFDSLAEAQSAARRAGWVCDPLGGDVLCPLCRRVEPGTVLPLAVAS